MPSICEKASCASPQGWHAHKNVLVIYVANNARPGNEAAHEVNIWTLKCVDQHGQSAQINVPGDVPDVRALLCSQSQCQFLHFQ